MATKTALVRALKRLRAYLEIDGANTFKVNAYVKAVRVLEDEALDVGRHVEEKTLTEMDGIGKGIAEKIVEFWNEGEIAELSELEEKYPEGLLEMTEIPGFGAKKAVAVWKELGVEDTSQLEQACEDGRVAGLKGFGQKTAEKVLAGIAQRRKHSGRFLLDVARGTAEPLLAALAACDAVQRVEMAGSLRRWRETIKDVDFVVATDDPPAVMEVFTGYEAVERVTGQGETKASVVLDSGMAADLRCVPPAQFPFALMYFTGSKEHNTALRGLARTKGLKLNEYGLFPDGEDESLGAADEAAIYAHLGLAWIPPEMREDMGEIDLAAGGEMPRLVEMDDIHGLPHMHTTASDGHVELGEYVEWAAEHGIQWMGIADHSRAASYAGGLSVEDVEEQFAEIDALNRKAKARGVRLLKGIESDILADGSLDYDDDLLARFDFVVASVHSQFNLAEEAQTERIVRAIENPHTTILGHMTGRLLLRRDGYAVNQRRLIEKCAECGVAIELNANPQRLDMDWRLVRTASEAGAVFSIGPDAHDLAGLAHTRFGVAQARKGWLGPGRIVNSMDADGFLDFARKRRG